MADRYFNPFQAIDINIPVEFHEAFTRYCQRSADAVIDQSPFPRMVDLWFLSIFGDNVEDAMGPGRFALFYLLCGLAAVAAQVISDPTSALPMVGASGAIGGVMGAYAVLYPRAPVRVLFFFGFFFTTISVPAVAMLGFWFLIQLLGGIPALQSDAGGVAFWAHVGGFVAGVALIHAFRDPVRLAAHRAHMALLWSRERP